MSFFDGNLNIEVAVASGIEAVTKRELTSLGYAPGGANYGRILFEGNFLDVARANMFLRTANRVRILLSVFKAETFDELYDNLSIFSWSEVFDKNAKVIVNAKSIKSKLFALSSIQSIAKKAISVSLAKAYGLNTLSENGETYDVEVAFYEDTVSVTLDTSGNGLHKRGYRTYLGEAPIRETLAAAIVLLSVWNPQRNLIDPFCGSGTIPIEAARIALNIASGRDRNFAYENFTLAPSVRGIAQDEALQNENLQSKLHISGFDINPEAIKLSLKHATRAGVANNVHFQVADMKNLSSHYEYGVLITNPPYGERLMDEDEVKVLYRDFGTVYRSLSKWSAYVITSFKGFEKYFGMRANKVRKLYNSELECNLYQYLGEKPPVNIKNKD